MKPSGKFQKWLKATPPPWRIGELLITPATGFPPAYSVRHFMDAGEQNLEISVEPLAARTYVKLDRDGNYRNLKGEGNLRRGWALEKLDYEALCLVLNIFYPTAIANWALHHGGMLPIVTFEETAARQTGRYRMVGHATPEQVANVVNKLCHARCLKVPLWRKEKAAASDFLLCPETCNLFISMCRDEMNGENRK